MPFASASSRDRIEFVNFMINIQYIKHDRHMYIQVMMDTKLNYLKYIRRKFYFFQRK